MNVSLLKDLDEKASNVERIPFSYNWDVKSGDIQPNKVIFFGSDFRTLAGIDIKESSRITNLCLDYIRKNCLGLKFYYKPHPLETDEITMLNLDGFEVIRERNNAEIFLSEHRHEIKYAFSHNSTASASALGFGINAYIFLEPYRKCVGDTLTNYWKEVLFYGLPESFFINSLDQPLKENKVGVINTAVPSSLISLIERNTGIIWFVMTNISYLATTMVLSQHIKSLKGHQKIKLIISRHIKWDKIDMSLVRKHFDEVIILPRVFYSLRPARVWQSLKIVLGVWRIRLDPSDLIFGFSSSELVENAFISHHKKNFKVLFINWDEINMGYKISSLPFFKRHMFAWPKSSRFYNLILEPMLGLHKTLFLNSTSENVINIYRYEKSIHEIYDRVYIFSNNL